MFRGVLSPPGGALESARALHCNRIGGFVRELLSSLISDHRRGALMIVFYF